MFGLDVDASTENNNWGLSVLIAFASGVWLLLSLPWFIMEKRRPGMDVESSIVVAGLWQLWRAITQIWHLRQSLCYLIGYFLLGDSLNTSVTVIGTLQNAVVEFNTLELTYLLLVGIAAQGVGIYAFCMYEPNLTTKCVLILYQGLSRNDLVCQPRRCSVLWELGLFCSTAGA